MGYSRGSNNRRWGSPIGISAVLILMIVLMGTAGMPAPAFAANIGCGQCHGVLDNGTNAVTSNTTDRRGTGEPGYEGSTIPTPDNGVRGLHGIHMNYSSATYGVVTTNQLVNGLRYSSRGNCSYCHNGHPRHATGYVNFTTAAAISKKPRQTVTQPLLGNKYLMSYTSAGRGVSYKNNIPSLTNYPTGNCTKACHKGTSQTNPAPWGNYTTASVILSCSSCHADSSGVSGTEAALSGAHAAHLASGARIALANATTMNSASNGSCKNCHPDNRGEGKTTSDWGTKAYPHASDGTNVLSKNANISGAVSITLTNWTGSFTNPGCANACHPRSSLINAAPFNKSISWGGSMDCNMCHYYEATPTLANNTTIKTGMLPGAHGLHIAGNVACSSCHGTVPTDTSHVTSLPVSYAGVALVSGLGYSQSSNDVATGSSGTCQNSCHLSASSPWSTTTAANGCAGCHEYPGAASDWTSTNGHSVRLSTNNLQTYTHLSPSSSYNAQTDQYGGPGGVTNDVNKCGLCHGGGTHMNGRVDKIPAANTAYGYDGTHTFSIISSATSPNMTCSNVVCHSGNTTPNWW